MERNFVKERVLTCERRLTGSLSSRRELHGIETELGMELGETSRRCDEADKTFPLLSMTYYADISVRDGPVADCSQVRELQVPSEVSDERLGVLHIHV